MRKYKLLHFILVAGLLFGFKVHALAVMPLVLDTSDQIYTNDTQHRAYTVVDFTANELSQMGNVNGFVAYFYDSGNNQWVTSVYPGYALGGAPADGLRVLMPASGYISGSGYIELKHIQLYTNGVNTGYLNGNPDMCKRISGTACNPETREWYYYTSK